MGWFAKQTPRVLRNSPAAAQARSARLERVLGQPIESQVVLEMMIELATKALRWAYVSLANHSNEAAFADGFNSYIDLMHADLVFRTGGTGGNAELASKTKAHDDAYEESKKRDGILVGPVGKAALRESGAYFQTLSDDDPLRTLTNWISAAVNSRFLNFVNPAAVPKVAMQCAILGNELAVYRMGGGLPETNITSSRFVLRQTLIELFEELKPMIESGQLAFQDGKLVLKK